MIVVLDTNIWISALQFWNPNSVPLQALLRASREDTIATADELELEVILTLVKKFDWSSSAAQAAMLHFLARSVRCTIRHTVNLCRDPKDNIFLECAERTGANLLVTGDKDLLVHQAFANCRIVSAREYLGL